MRNSLTALIAILCLLVPHAQAKPAKQGKQQQVQKERLVLMPLRLGKEDQQLQGAMEMALVKGLQQRYEVFSGEQVAKKAREIFLKESKSAHKECDETRCLQGIAEAFQAELLATANITKQNGGYFIALSVQNLFDNKVVQSESVPCKGCDAFAVIEKLKELVGTPDSAPAAATQSKVNQNDPDAVLWAEVQKGNAAEDYQVYIDSYPKGKYLPLAKARIKKLKEEAQAAAEQHEQQAWDDAQQSASQDSYNTYLSVYPKGRFAALAQARLAKLKKEEADADAKQRREQLAEETRRRREQADAAKSAARGPAMVRIPGKNYEMGKYEVTRGEFAKFVSETGYDAGSACNVFDGSKWESRSGSNWRNPGIRQDDSHPVTCVNWDDAQAYIAWLSKKTGQEYHLPTEAEWEYACYGGNKTEYCGSNDIDAVAWYAGNSGNTSHSVGQKQANGYGLYDMSGNVWQWMQNSAEGGRVLRGCAWTGQLQFAKASFRGAENPANRLNHSGFRLARTLP